MPPCERIHMKARWPHPREVEATAHPSVRAAARAVAQLRAVTQLLVVAHQSATRVLRRSTGARHRPLPRLAPHVLPRSTRRTTLLVQRRVRAVLALRREFRRLVLSLVGHGILSVEA